MVAKLENLQELRKRKRIINNDECKYDLRNHLSRFFRAFYKALKNYNVEIVMTKPEARCRGHEATILNSKIIEAMQDEFGDNWSFGRYRRFMVRVDGYIVLFKKLGKDGLPMNVKTKNSTNIANQQQGNLFGFDDDGTEPILFFGYKKNIFGEIVNPQLVYIDENKKKFSITEDQLLTPLVAILPNKEDAVVTVKDGISRNEKNVI